MIRPFTRHASIVLFLFGCVFSSAQPLEIELNEVDVKVDGMRSHYLELNGHGFKGKRFPGGNWVLSEDAPGGASVRFFHRYQTEIFMDFAVFEDAVLIKDYSESGLKKYVLSLKPDYARQGFKLAGARAAKAPVGSMPFMGGSYWKITYTLIEAQTGRIQKSVVEFVSVDEEQNNYRLRFSGPAVLVEKFEGKFVDEVGRFTLD